MRRLTRSLALLGALALALPAPLNATDESPEGIRQAVTYAEDARDHVAETFGQAPKNGKFVWQEGADTISHVVISRRDQLAYVYDEDRLVAVSTISSGREGYPTPPGIFPILAKHRTYFSKKYDNAPMPYMQRLDDYGIALHAGKLPGYPASHGCIRLPARFAAKLFAATEIGTPVYIGA